MIALGCDHGGYDLMQAVIAYLDREGIAYKNLGCENNHDSVDYPDYGRKVVKAILSGECEKGIVICGTGIGVSIAANKVKGAYAALLSDVYSAQRARLSNDANIACMGAFTTGCKERELMVDAFLGNEFVPGCSSQPKVDAFVKYDRER